MGESSGRDEERDFVIIGEFPGPYGSVGDYPEPLPGWFKEIYECLRKNCQREYRWLEDIIPNGTYQDALDLSLRVSKSERFYIIAHHEEDEKRPQHIHIYHGCPFRKSYCYCSIWGTGSERRFKPRNRFGRRSVRIEELEEGRIATKITYLAKEGRHLTYIGDNGKNFLLSVDTVQILREYSRSKQNQSVRPMEVCYELLRDGHTSSFKAYDGSSIEGTSKRMERVQKGRIPGIKAPYKRAMTVQQMIKILSYYNVSPILSTCEHPEYLNNEEHSYYDQTEKLYLKAVDVHQRRISNWSYNDFKNYYAKCETHPKFHSKNESHYLSIAESYNAIMELLIHQYGDFEEAINFLKRFYNILEKVEPKRNTMCVRGPANAGKK